MIDMSPETIRAYQMMNPFSSRCVCGEIAERFEVWRDNEPESPRRGQVVGIVAIVGGEACCSAFGWASEQARSESELEAMVARFNSRPTDLGVESGSLR